MAYGPRLFARPSDLVEQHDIGPFSFENGILSPHKEYLYGSSGVGAPFIVGKKVDWEDYSRWEAEYLDFPRLKAITFTGSGSETTWSSSFEAPKASANSPLLRVLLWLVFGTMCTLLLFYLIRKAVSRLSLRKSGNDEEVLALPTDEIDAEFSKLNQSWRSTLIRMHREQKSEILSLPKDEVVELQREIDNLRQKLNTESSRAQDLESTSRELELQNTDLKETVKSLEEEVLAFQSGKDLESTSRELEMQNTDLKETVKSLKEEVQALQSGKKAGNMPAKNSEESEEGKEEGEHEGNEMKGAMGLEMGDEEGNENDDEGNEDDANAPRGTQGGSGGVRYNRKKLRSNKRADGSIRTSKHPQSTPPRQQIAGEHLPANAQGDFDGQEAQPDAAPIEPAVQASTPTSVEQASDQANVEPSKTRQPARICQFFLEKGGCKFGEKCFNYHVLPTRSDINSEPPKEPAMQDPTSAPVQPAIQDPTRAPVQPAIQDPTPAPVQPAIQDPTPASVQLAGDQRASQSSTPRPVRRVCMFYRLGNCKFGARCLDSHDLSVTDRGSSHGNDGVPANAPTGPRGGARGNLNGFRGGTRGNLNDFRGGGRGHFNDFRGGRGGRGGRGRP